MFTSFPASNRRGIAFFVEKTEAAFKTDPYERYREAVVRQLAIHYADSYWGAYPFQKIIDWVHSQLPSAPNLSFLDVGCGVGRLLREVALLRPDWKLFGIDYSYNALRSCRQLWQLGQNIELDYQERGLPIITLSGEKIPQLQIGLSQADKLPMADNSMDVIVNTFLLDRIDQPEAAVTEWFRVLRPGGILIVASPLNWQSIQTWKRFPTSEKTAASLFSPLTWKVLDQATIAVQEPLDSTGNFVHWNVSSWCFEKVDA